VWDLESALLYLVRVEGAKEYITNDKSTWVTFRAGHAGDASTIASLYRQSKRRNMQENSPELETAQIDNNSEEESSVSSMLEVWLADGMGDEDTPPSVYSLLAHVHTGTTIQDPSPAASESSTTPTTTATTTTLGAVSLLTLAWTDGERILRVEWMHVDPSLSPEVTSTLEKRLWLRMSSLSWMTACQLLTVDEQHTSPADASEEVSKPLPPSAE
jgi:hypothetical protein